MEHLLPLLLVSLLWAPVCVMALVRQWSHTWFWEVYCLNGFWQTIVLPWLKIITALKTDVCGTESSQRILACRCCHSYYCCSPRPALQCQLCSQAAGLSRLFATCFLPSLRIPLGVLGPLPPPLSFLQPLFRPSGSYCFFPHSVQQHIVCFTFPFPVCSESSCFVFLAYLFVLYIKCSKISLSVHCLKLHLYIHKRKCYRCPNKGKIDVFIEEENHKQSQP